MSNFIEILFYVLIAFILPVLTEEAATASKGKDGGEDSLTGKVVYYIANPYMMMFGGLLLIVAIVAIVVMVKKNNNSK